MKEKNFEKQFSKQKTLSAQCMYLRTNALLGVYFYYMIIASKNKFLKKTKFLRKKHNF